MALLIVITPAHAELRDIPVATASSSPTETIQNKIDYYASLYDVDPVVMGKVVYCETAGTYDPTIQSKSLRPDGSQEKSFGLAQIFLEKHPDITYEQAIDPDFALLFIARQFAAGHQYLWSCYNDMKKMGKL